MAFMRTSPARMAIALALVVTGCSQPNVPTSPAALEAGPHGGTAQRLPGDRGYLEVVNEPESSNPRSPTPTAIVVYFLDTERKAAIATPPSEVSVVIYRGQKGTEN